MPDQSPRDDVPRMVDCDSREKLEGRGAQEKVYTDPNDRRVRVKTWNDRIAES